MGHLTVHPRVHGELGVVRDQITGRDGSSPRTRGTPKIVYLCPTCARFIPAYTGNSRNARHGTPCRSGSSPRTRGTPPGPCSWSRMKPVHPRVHGELPCPSPLIQSTIGSSPRTRGTRDVRRRPGGDGRFIPAYTGNSAGFRATGAQPSVHPRVHGELEHLEDDIQTDLGSSPRTRGTHRIRPHRPLAVRFIPAYTGNSRRARRAGRSKAVHPRVHGELTVATKPYPEAHGSSPRTRGTLPLARLPLDLMRFIPAYTGNSPSRSQLRIPLPVHPRVHGELAMSGGVPVAMDGSSPRTRGTPEHCRRLDPVCRFIPAYTGNSPAHRP